MLYIIFSEEVVWFFGGCVNILCCEVAWFFVWRDCVSFCEERLREFFWGCMILWWRGCVIFLEVAYFFWWRGCITFCVEVAFCWCVAWFLCGEVPWYFHSLTHFLTFFFEVAWFFVVKRLCDFSHLLTHSHFFCEFLLHFFWWKIVW